MIILDSNILWGVTLENSTSDLLRALAAADVRVAVPWVVLEELASQRTLEYVAAHEAASLAITRLERHVPWGELPSLGQAEQERHREHWRQVYRRMVEVIDPSPEALRTALFRESNVLAPCKRVGKGDKTGSRDAVIWLTAVEYARAHEDETVYFVSANTKDFGDGTDYPEPMRSDLAGIEDRFTHFTSLDEVVELFAKPAELDEGFLPAILARTEWTSIVADALADHLPKFDPNDGREWLDPDLAYTPLEEGQVGEVRSALGWFDPPSLAFDGATDMTAHSIDGQVWSTATVRWLALGLMQLTGHRLIPAANILETRLLVSQDESGAARASILHSRPPRVLTAEEVSRVPNTWTNWRQELTERFPSNSYASRGLTPPAPPNLAQINPSIDAVAALIALAVTGWTNRKKSK